MDEFIASVDDNPPGSERLAEIKAFLQKVNMTDPKELEGITDEDVAANFTGSLWVKGFLVRLFRRANDVAHAKRMRLHPPEHLTQTNEQSASSKGATSVGNGVSEPSGTTPIANAVSDSLLATADSERRYVGKISLSPDEDMHFGVIKSPEVTKEFGVDAFLCFQDLAGFGVGSEVSFKVALDEKRCPQACDLRDPPDAPSVSANISGILPNCPVNSLPTTGMPHLEGLVPEVESPSEPPSPPGSGESEMSSEPVPPREPPPRKPSAISSKPVLDKKRCKQACDLRDPSESPSVSADPGESETSSKPVPHIKPPPGNPSAISSKPVLDKKRCRQACDLKDPSKSPSVSADTGESETSSKPVPHIKPPLGNPSAISSKPVLDKKRCRQACDLRGPSESPSVSADPGESETLSKPVPHIIPSSWPVPHIKPPLGKALRPAFSAPILSRRYVGVISGFQPYRNRKYGFITSEGVTRAYGDDAFLSHKELKDFKNDDTVSFLIRLNTGGRPQAYDLTSVT